MEKIKLLTPKTVAVLEGKSKYAPCILEEAIYLDTETSHVFDEETGEGVGWIYQWALRFVGEWAFGRKPSEILAALKKIAQTNRLYNTKCVVYVHNLSFDIQYLKDWLIKIYGKDSYTLIAMNPHKFISFSIGPWIFKCTYKLSNRSLAKWAKDLNTKARKQVGIVDYNVTRYQDSKLTYADWKYMYYDVLTLEECVKKQLSNYGDTLATVPLTSTGYIRRDARKRFKADRKNRVEFEKSKLDPHLYKLFRQAFAGGITHQNRFIKNDIVTPPEGCEIRHRDFRSHYPTQQVARETGFPVGSFVPFYRYREGRAPFTFYDVDKWKKTHCLIIKIAIKNMTIKDGVTFPYAQSVKWFEGRTKSFIRTIDDNGRVLQALGCSVVTLTELDLKWIRKQYTFEYTILEVYGACRGSAPEYLIDTVKEKYLGKTQYKEEVKQARKEGKPSEIIQDLETSLMKSKNGLNGIYGMSATNPVRTEYVLKPNGEWETEQLTEEKVEEKLAKFYKSRNNFMAYQLGVYTTALARNDLMSVVEIIGYKNVLYVDTDSAFYISSPEVEKRIDEYNEKQNEHAEKIGAYIVYKDKKIYFDAFDDEGENITRFVALHAKAYAYETPRYKKEKCKIPKVVKTKGKATAPNKIPLSAKRALHCTIAGVTEHGRNGNTRTNELGCLENMKECFTFKDCGGTRCVYLESEPHIETVNGHLLEVAGSAIILPVEKTLSGLITHEEFMSDFEAVEDDNDEKYSQ